MSTAPLLSFFFLFAFSLLLSSNQLYTLHSWKKQHINSHQSLNKFLYFWEKISPLPTNNHHSLRYFSTLAADNYSCHFLRIKSWESESRQHLIFFMPYAKIHSPRIIKIGLTDGLKILFSARLRHRHSRRQFQVLTWNWHQTLAPLLSRRLGEY